MASTSNDIPHSTYGNGFYYRARSILTRGEFVELLDELNKEFGDGWSFEPEPIHEGGIEVVNWPGKEGKQYKAMRLCKTRGMNYDQMPWPWIKDTWRERWTIVDKNDILFIGDVKAKRPLREWNSTVLKAFYGAPAWTSEELGKIEKVFAKFNIEVNYKGSCVRRQPN